MVRRRKAKALRAFPSVSYKRAKTVVERERNKGTRKCYEIFAGLLRERENGRKRTQEKEHENARSISAGLLERAKVVERQRNKHAT